MDTAGRERGATAVAYAVMVAIIALLLVGAVFLLSGSVGTALDSGADCVADPGGCEGVPGGGGPGGTGGGNEGGATTTTVPAPTSTTTGS